MLEALANFIEWYGTIAIIGAYGLMMFRVIAFQGQLFFILNLSGAIALVVGGTFKRTQWNIVLFYFIWAVITALVYFNPFHLHF